MGGGGSSTEYITQTIEIRADPRLLASLEQIKSQTALLKESACKLENDLKNAQLEAKQKSDPALYERYRQQAFDRYVDQLSTMTFTKPIQKESASERHHVVIGNISSGKSSLLNKFFGLNEPVGCGECTQKPKIVTKAGNVIIWDSPGINQEFKIYDPNVLSFFHCADKVFILFPDSLKSCPEIVKVIAKIKPNSTYLIRTQTDNWNANMKKTIQQEIETDKAILMKWGLKLPVYATSAKKDMGFQDNATVCQMMKSP